MFLQPKITGVEPREGYKLKVFFETGEEADFDVKPYIKGTWFGMLSDPAYFKRVSALSDGSGIEWPDGQDIAPHELYEKRLRTEPKEVDAANADRRRRAIERTMRREVPSNFKEADFTALIREDREK
jgi:hypothetical protein